MSVESSSPSSWWSRYSSVNASSKTTTTTSRDKNGNSNDLMTTLVELFLEIGAILVTSYIGSLFIGKLLQEYNNPNGMLSSKEGTAAEKRLQALLKSQGKDDAASQALSLSNYERQIADDVIDPSDIPTDFTDIGGIDDIKQELWELAVLPLQRPDLFSSSKLLQTRVGGILLYGPPGTGKTMLAKAIAKEANATFLAVKLSKIMNKWFGESNKLIDAIFSLARKLAPSIIFIDELDTFLNPRDGSNDGAGSAIKAEFLTLWDGISTRQDQTPVVVLGATNRPNHVDAAILRRLPRMFRIELPNEKGRLQILNLVLKDHPLDASAKAYLPRLAKECIGYSGSDLKEMCHCAALESIRDVVKETSRQAVTNKRAPKKSSVNHKKNRRNKQQKQQQEDEGEETSLRPMSKRDLQIAKTKVKRTGQDAADYERSKLLESHSDAASSPTIPNGDPLQQLLALSKLLSNPSLSIPANDGGGKQNNDDEGEDDEIPQL